MDSREYLTVSELNATLRIGFQRDMVNLADKLLNAGLIDNDCHTRVTATPDHAGANRMLQSVKQSIAMKANNFGKLISVLETNKKHYGSLVEDLKKEYRKQEGTIADVQVQAATPPASQAVPQSAAEPDTTQQAVSQPSQDKPFVLELPAHLPNNFSTDFDPREFAQWMKGRKFLLDEDCKRIIDFSITGSVFVELDEATLKKYGFEKAGFYYLRSVLKKVAVKTIPVDSDGKEQPESESFPAMDRGEYKPKLKFKPDNQVAELKPKQKLKILDSDLGYYPMQAKKHGVCLIINNKTFKEPDHQVRCGTERDEYNLIETWRYLGYHVEVCREAKYHQIMTMLYDIDDLLSEVNNKSKSKVENDSFVCCILSHGDKFCIYSSDSIEVPIDDMERAVGESDILRDKPKMFFIQACQGNRKGEEAVPSKLPVDKSGYVSDGKEVKTSKRCDIFISYATVQGDQSYRHPTQGSLYVGALCKTFCEEAKRCALDELQKYINERVSDEDFEIESYPVKVSQQPSSGGQLRRNVHFFFESTP